MPAGGKARIDAEAAALLAALYAAAAVAAALPHLPHAHPGGYAVALLSGDCALPPPTRAPPGSTLSLCVLLHNNGPEAELLQARVYAAPGWPPPPSPVGAQPNATVTRLLLPGQNATATVEVRAPAGGPSHVVVELWRYDGGGWEYTGVRAALRLGG